ncbi:MAG: glycosyl hydrolase [Mangrovibacterium sp.]
MENRIRSLAMLAVSFWMICCSGGGPGEEPVDLQAPTVSSSQNASIGEGAVVSVDLGSITVYYTAPLSLVNAGKIVLSKNSGEAVNVTATVANKNLKVSFGTLEGNTVYKLTVGDGAVAHQLDATLTAGAFTLNFSTEFIIPESVTFQIDPALTNPNASTQAVKVYHYLLSSFGKKTLSATMAMYTVQLNEAEWVYERTGKYPAMTCFDFMNATRDYDHSWDPDYDEFVTNATKWWNDGGIVCAMWHWRDPLKTTDAFYTAQTTFDISKISNPSSDEYKAVIADIDVVAGYLKQLADVGIPVIWRPMHEAQGGWFWWGAKAAADCKALWQLMYNRLTNHHGLNNLIWVWTIDMITNEYKEAFDWYPGANYVDLVGTDIYAGDHSSQLQRFNFTAVISGQRKIVALTECGPVPNPVTMATSDTWAYFMPWYGGYTREETFQNDNGQTLAGNGPAYWQQLFGNSFVITRDELPDLK